MAWWWWVAGGIGAGVLLYGATASASVRSTPENIEYLARMLCMHSSLSQDEWVGLSWLVLNRLNNHQCATVRECVTSPSWSTNEERRRRLAAPSGYQDGSGKPAPPDNPRWEEALELAEDILDGQYDNPIGSRTHFFHPQSLRACAVEGATDGSYICYQGKWFPTWGHPEYADQEPVVIGITWFS